MLSNVRKYVKPKSISHQNKKLTQQHNWKKGSSSPREVSVFKKNLIGFLYFTETMTSKLSVIVYFFLALYGSTTIQSRFFLKNIENFVWFPKQYLLSFFLLEKQLANILDRGFLFLRNTLLLYSLSPYRRMESQTEKWIHSLRVGWRNFFSSCVAVSVFGSGGK